MSSSFDLNPVARITTGAIGQPGERTFYLQADDGGRVVTLLIEKGQVAALAQHIESLLEQLPETEPESPDAPPEELGLVEPFEPQFRVGSMSLEYDPDRGLIVLQCEEFVPQPEDEDEPVPDASVARFWATRRQMRALARHGAEIVAAGRPLCALCGAAIDPDGHACPALNGHRKDHGLGT